MPFLFAMLGILPGAGLLALSIYFLHQLINIQRYTTRFTIDDGLIKGEFSPAFVALEKESFQVHSPFGYDLSGFAIPGNTDKTIIFCHGASWTRWGMAKYMHTFLERGWNIVAYDSRAHGESGGTYPSYGYYEKHDLKAVEDWTMARFPATKHLGIYGESMGAATVLQYSPLSSHASFLVLESPFSDLNTLCRTRLAWSGVPGFIIPAVMWLADCYIRFVAGFRIRDVSPRQSLDKTTVPILFFHGKDDEQIPTSMSIAMYHARRERFPTRLALFDNTLHTRCIVVDEKRYLSELWSFLTAIELA